MARRPADYPAAPSCRFLPSLLCASRRVRRLPSRMPRRPSEYRCAPWTAADAGSPRLAPPASAPSPSSSLQGSRRRQSSARLATQQPLSATLVRIAWDSVAARSSGGAAGRPNQDTAGAACQGVSKQPGRRGARTARPAAPRAGAAARRAPRPAAAAARPRTRPARARPPAPPPPPRPPRRPRRRPARARPQARPPAARPLAAPPRRRPPARRRRPRTQPPRPAGAPAGRAAHIAPARGRPSAGPSMHGAAAKSLVVICQADRILRRCADADRTLQSHAAKGGACWAPTRLQSGPMKCCWPRPLAVRMLSWLTAPSAPSAASASGGATQISNTSQLARPPSASGTTTAPGQRLDRQRPPSSLDRQSA